MIKIEEIIFFYSSYSSHCHNAKNFIEKNNIPVNLILVDNPEIRKAMKNMKFEIDSVPSILVNYSDGNSELYKGNKVILWFEQLLEQQHQQNEEYNSLDEYNEVQDIMNTESKTGYGIQETYQPMDEGYSEHSYSYNNTPDVTNMAYTPEGFSQDKPNLNSQKMQGIKNIAQQMEEERKNSLGYDEEKLPRYG